MHLYAVTIVRENTRTRLLLSLGPDKLLRAVLPPGRRQRHKRAAAALIEGLSLWLDSPLCVVLCADAKDASLCLGLADELGRGERALFFEVEVAPRRALAHGVRLSVVGDFRLLHQLALWPSPIARTR